MKQQPLEALSRIAVVDSHTGGMPTRVILDGFPELPSATVAGRRDQLRRDFAHLSRALVAPPRGQEGMVGALLVPPDSPQAATGVIFFDQSEVIGMCGHGAIGLAHTLRALGRIGDGRHTLDTPAGQVSVECLADGRVAVANVPSRRLTPAVSFHADGVGEVTGDIAYGGNTFLVVTSPRIDLNQPLEALVSTTKAILAGAHRAGHRNVDHIELLGPPTQARANARNFVLCPSGTYDRSPCGTGTSAKVACLADDGKLRPGEPWLQESISGSLFTVSYQWIVRDAGVIAPLVVGAAELTAKADLLFAPPELKPRPTMTTGRNQPP